MIASAAFMHSTHVSRTRPICSVIVWTRPFGALATLLSNSYSVKKIGVPKGGSAETVETPLDPPLSIV